MAFNLSGLTVSTVIGLNPKIQKTDIAGNIVGQSGCFRGWDYDGSAYTAGVLTGESQATMSASGYFNLASGQINVSDLIRCFSETEGTYVTYKVTATAPNVTLAPLGEVVLSKSVNVTAANLNGMYLVPVLMFPAPGAGLAYQIISWSVNTQTAGAPTVYANGGPLVLEYGNAANGAGPVAALSIPATVLTTGTPNNLGLSSGCTGIGLAAASLVNQPIYLSNTGATFANGTSTAVVSASYRIIVAS